MNENTSTAIIILAAGSSSRMGTSKQLLAWGHETLLSKAVAVARAVNPGKLLVVLGANKEAHYQVLKDEPVEIVENNDWQKGMGSSLKKAIAHLAEQNTRCKEILVMVCDQPLITTELLLQLLAKHRETKKEIVGTYYSNSVGVPVLFSLSLMPLLLQIPDSEGAKKFIQQHVPKVDFVAFEKAGMDVDTPEDYHKIVPTN